MRLQGGVVEFHILGTLEMWSDGERVALGPPKQRAVLAILLLHAGQVVPTDRLIELIWGERPPRTAAHSIQIYVSELRKALEPHAGTQVIATRPPGYVLEVDPDEIDVRRSERLLARAARDLAAADPASAAAGTHEALDLWGGRPLADFAYDEFAQEEIRRLEALHVDAHEQLAAAELALGHEPAALAATETAIAEDPLRERARELQMLALYRSGRQAEALRAYQGFQSLLREELDVEPTPSLRRLQERILVHDATLGPAVPSISMGAPIRNPYKGLRPFGEEDAGDFFGRDSLIAELIEALASGSRLVTLVGPSGCGKSSVIGAGLLPALRTGAIPGSDRWVIARMRPGRQPFEELEAALRAAADASTPGPPAGRADDGAKLPDLARRIAPEGGRAVLVIDQLEELFSGPDEPTRLRFLRDLTAAIDDPDGGLVVVLGLRADFYDRPLQHPGFAAAFSSGVVNVLPLTADALEAAVVGPARRVDTDVDPALVAQLTADMIDRPGALPLLQHTLAELFDRRTDHDLTLEDYRALGGLHDAISRRADELYARLDEDRRAATLQVFLRLVEPDDGGDLARRRVPVRELTDLELDPVVLAEVLDAFARHRLLSFDRDPASGDATVEVGHEALLVEWERLAGWIERHRADLRQHRSFVAAVTEWEASGRDRDYLVIGSRLAAYEGWTAGTAMRLTGPEREFLDAALARRRSEEAAAEVGREGRRRLERRAKVRLWGLLAAVAALAAAVSFGFLSWLGNGPPDAVLLFQGTGGAGFGDLAATGFDRAMAELGLNGRHRTVSLVTDEVEAELRQLSEAGVPLVVVGLGAPATQAETAVAGEHPATRYVVWEIQEHLTPNMTNLTFRSAEGAYLAGVAAARTSRTGVIGFVGAVRDPIIDAYLAGFEAGARSVRPDIAIRVRYLVEKFEESVFSSPPLGALAAEALYDEGADVIFAVAGTSSQGVFEAATSRSTALRRQLWAIGVDTDEYRSVLEAPVAEGVDPRAWQPHILTSVTKRLDVAFETALGDYARGALAPGERSFGLAEGGVDISYSGGFIEDLRPQLDTIRAGIVSGAIRVPTVPTETAGSPPP